MLGSSCISSTKMSCRGNLSFPQCQFQNVRTPAVPVPILIVSNHNSLHLEGRLNPEGHKVLIDTYVSLRSWLNGVCRPDYNRPAIKQALDELNERKKEYWAAYAKATEKLAQTEELARKRAREEFPSDNESSSNPSSQKSSQSKRSRKKRRKSVEEEIVAPKLSNHGTISPLPLRR